MQEVWREGVAVFVKELAKRTPIDSGESIAALIPLGRFVRAAANFSGGKGTTRKGMDPKTGRTVDEPRGRSRGKRLGEKVFRIGGSQNILNFTFSIPTYQAFLHYNGFAGSSNNLAAIGAIEEAQKAQLEYVRREMPKAVNDVFRKWILNGGQI
jgi:hypothetical protein